MGLVLSKEQFISPRDRPFPLRNRAPCQDPVRSEQSIEKLLGRAATPKARKELEQYLSKSIYCFMDRDSFDPQRIPKELPEIYSPTSEVLFFIRLIFQSIDPDFRKRNVRELLTSKSYVKLKREGTCIFIDRANSTGTAKEDPRKDAETIGVYKEVKEACQAAFSRIYSDFGGAGDANSYINLADTINYGVIESMRFVMTLIKLLKTFNNNVRLEKKLNGKCPYNEIEVRASMTVCDEKADAERGIKENLIVLNPHDKNVSCDGMNRVSRINGAAQGMGFVMDKRGYHYLKKIVQVNQVSLGRWIDKELVNVQKRLPDSKAELAPLTPLEALSTYVNVLRAWELCRALAFVFENPNLGQGYSHSTKYTELIKDYERQRDDLIISIHQKWGKTLDEQMKGIRDKVRRHYAREKYAKFRSKTKTKGVDKDEFDVYEVLGFKPLAQDDFSFPAGSLVRKILEEDRVEEWINTVADNYGVSTTTNLNPSAYGNVMSVNQLTGSPTSAHETTARAAAMMNYMFEKLRNGAPDDSFLARAKTDLIVKGVYVERDGTLEYDLQAANKYLAEGVVLPGYYQRIGLMALLQKKLRGTSSDNVDNMSSILARHFGDFQEDEADLIEIIKSTNIRSVEILNAINTETSTPKETDSDIPKPTEQAIPAGTIEIVGKIQFNNVNDQQDVDGSGANLIAETLKLARVITIKRRIESHNQDGPLSWDRIDDVVRDMVNEGKLQPQMLRLYRETHMEGQMNPAPQ